MVSPRKCSEKPYAAARACFTVLSRSRESHSTINCVAVSVSLATMRESADSLEAAIVQVLADGSRSPAVAEPVACRGRNPLRSERLSRRYANSRCSYKAIA